jgi:hypothetical protein
MQAGGANARPFTTIAQAIGNIPLFLRVAPELYLKVRTYEYFLYAELFTSMSFNIATRHWWI